MPMTPADVEKYLVAELSSNEKLIRAAGIKSSAAPAHKRPLPKMALPMKMEVQPGRQS
jgi:hypothetical protein